MEERGRQRTTGLEDDLLFDLEYDQTDRRRSASADSWVGDVRVEVEREEGTVPDPDLRRVRSFKLRQEEWYGSLPGHSRHRRNIDERNDAYPDPRPGGGQLAYSVPRNHLQHVPWDEDSPGLASPELTSSVSSVEEATEHLSDDHRQPFNLLSVSGPQSAAKSGRFIPRFLRASFSKLISKEKGRKGSLVYSTPVSRSPSIHNCGVPEPTFSDQELQSPDYSPTTGQFIQECLDKGLPIIPFNYRPRVFSTAEIVEKQRQSQRRKVSQEEEAERDDWGTKPSSPRDRYTDSSWREREEDKSLEGLLTLARREIEQEKQLKKISASGITGYAANNSRALERRRSSVSEYVLSQDEEEGGERLRLGRQPSKKKIRKHVLTQERYEAGEGTRAVARRAASLDQYLDMDCTQRH